MLLKILDQNPGKKIGPYILDKPVGEGRYGKCYLAHDADDRPVIIKRYKPGIFKKNKNKNAWEAVILSHINYPAIPELLGVIHEKGFYAFVLGYKPGITVETLLFRQKHRFSSREVFIIGSKLIEIIKYLHQNGIVHRDIRTPNVLIDKEDVYLLDFGLARWADDRRYAYDIDYAYLGDFLLHLLYSACEECDGKAPWHQALPLPAEQRFFLKRLLKLERPFTDVLEIQRLFQQLFSQ